MIFIVLPILFFVFFNSAFIIDQSKQVIITEFGKLVKIYTSPGLHFKIPFIQSTYFYEKRVLNCDVSEVELTLGDQKRLVVDVLARYYIKDPVLFFKSVHNQHSAAKRLKLIIIGDVRDVLGQVVLQDIISKKRNVVISEIQKRVEKAVKVLGIGMMEVRIKKAILPDENNEAVFNRMRSERAKEAQEWRGQAEQVSKSIISNANLESSSIIAQAKRSAEVIKGKADADAMKILQSCYGENMEFTQLLLNIQSYKKALNNEKVCYWLSSQNNYFKMINDQKGMS